MAEGRMDAAGLAEVTRAKTDGRWEAAYASQASIEVPADLAAALVTDPTAKAMFDILTSQNRYAVLYRIDAASELKRGRDASSSMSPCSPEAKRSTHRSARDLAERRRSPERVGLA